MQEGSAKAGIRAAMQTETAETARRKTRQVFMSSASVLDANRRRINRKWKEGVLLRKKQTGRSDKLPIAARNAWLSVSLPELTVDDTVCTVSS